MVEGKAVHNAQVADLDTKATDAYVNKSTKAVSGLVSTTQLRCDLGVLPAELVVHRNAMYYLWHLKSLRTSKSWGSTWFSSKKPIWPRVTI